MSAAVSSAAQKRSKKCCSLRRPFGPRICGWPRSVSNHQVVPERWVPTPTKSGGPVRGRSGATGGGQSSDAAGSLRRGSLRRVSDPGWLVLAADQVTGVLGDTPAPDAIEARRMQALSLAVHIPLVCFGIAFPAMFMFVHGLYLRTGAAHYKALAKRWSKVALILFAVGVVTGTILSFEFGLLWPEFMARYGEVFGIAFALEGISFFVEAIFIAIYVYGWDRLSKRAHFLTGIPVVVSGFAGSFNVIAVNGWMNDPTGFRVVGGKV